MATNNLSDIEGFVLREIKYKESSKILEIFTKEMGRISVIANSVESKKRQNLSSTLRFTKSSYNLNKSAKIYYLKDAYLLEGYSKSNRNYEIILYKSAICDLLLRTIDEIDKDTVYNLLDSTFRSFEDAKENYSYIFLSFMIKYISFIGFKPNLDYCSNDNKLIKKEDKISFSIQSGGVLCSNCISLFPDSINLTKKDLLDLKRLLYTPTKDISKLYSDIDKNKLYYIIIEFILDKLEIKKFSSLKWLDEIFKS
ncbi:MAG: DNA repair protein RecO [Tissierellia bacterium]|nr:DNA repair protein RecO [Tissierellia bacterium]